MRRKSIEEYMEECAPIATERGIIILGTYGEDKGSKTKMILRGRDCNHEWNTTTFNHFKSGSGCPVCAKEMESRGKAKKKNLETCLIECQPLAQERDIEIIGVVKPFKGVRTKMINRCKVCYHEWNTCSIANFKRGSGCPKCKAEKIGELGKCAVIPDDQHIQDFMNTGAFQPGTIFINTGERTGKSDSIWCIKCPICSYDEYVQAGVCDGKFYSTRGSLKNGSLACRCSTRYVFSDQQLTYRMRKELQKKDLIFIEWVGKPSVRLGKFKYGCKKHGVQIGRASSLLNHGTGCPQCANQTQQQCYINHIHDEQGILCALKFGIANNSDRRIKEQNSRNVFTMKQVQVWHFPTAKQCKDAEKRCKRVLHTEAVSKYAMPDGYTETAELSCMASIQNIYKLYGGTLQEETC